MNTSSTADLSERYRFRAEIISHCVWLYNRFSLSPTGQRKRTMRRFKSAGHAQRFLSAYGPILSHFQPRRHRRRARDYRQEMAYRRRQIWRETAATEAAA
jgi:transposase-like protein